MFERGSRRPTGRPSRIGNELPGIERIQVVDHRRGTSQHPEVIAAAVDDARLLIRIHAVPQSHSRAPLPEVEFGSTQADDTPVLRFLVVSST